MFKHLSQADLDANHERVRLIMESMDSVERQFESREVTVGQLETDLRGAQDLVSYLQQDINKAEQTIAGQKNELDRLVQITCTYVNFAIWGNYAFKTLFY